MNELNIEFPQLFENNFGINEYLQFNEDAQEQNNIYKPSATQVAHWVSTVDRLCDILKSAPTSTAEIKTAYGKQSVKRQKNNKNADNTFLTGANYDIRGNHICFSSNILNPANIMLKYNFGLILNRKKLEEYCGNNASNLGLKRVKQYDSWNEYTGRPVEDDNQLTSDGLYLSRHFDFYKNLKSIGNNLSRIRLAGGGLYVLYILKLKSQRYYVKFWNWEKPIEINEAAYNFFKNCFEDLVNLNKAYKYSADQIDNNIKNKNSNIEEIYASAKLTEILPLVKVKENYELTKSGVNFNPNPKDKNGKDIQQIERPHKMPLLFIDDAGHLGLRSHLIKAQGSDDDYYDFKFADKDSNIETEVIKAFNDTWTQEDEFRLYFNDEVKSFKFPINIIDYIYFPRSYHVVNTSSAKVKLFIDTKRALEWFNNKHRVIDYIDTLTQDNIKTMLEKLWDRWYLADANPNHGAFSKKYSDIDDNKRKAIVKDIYDRLAWLSRARANNILNQELALYDSKLSSYNPELIYFLLYACAFPVSPWKLEAAKVINALNTALDYLESCYASWETLFAILRNSNLYSKIKFYERSYSDNPSGEETLTYKLKALFDGEVSNAVVSIMNGAVDPNEVEDWLADSSHHVINRKLNPNLLGT